MTHKEFIKSLIRTLAECEESFDFFTFGETGGENDSSDNSAEEDIEVKA